MKNMNDPVLIAMENIVNDYGDQGSFVIDGKEYSTPEMMEQLRNGSDIGLKFRSQVNEIILLYLMKFKR